jgi:hypothetical protein
MSERHSWNANGFARIHWATERHVFNASLWLGFSALRGAALARWAVVDIPSKV